MNSRAKKIGIQIAHAGVIVLLVGQLATDHAGARIADAFTEGETRNYSDSATDYELIFLSGNEVTAIPEKMLKPGSRVDDRQDGLPFTIRVKEHWHNSDIELSRADDAERPAARDQRRRARISISRKTEDVKTMDQRNIPTALLEFVAPAGSLGAWVASDWAGDAALVEAVRNGYAPDGRGHGAENRRPTRRAADD